MQFALSTTCVPSNAGIVAVSLVRAGRSIRYVFFILTLVFGNNGWAQPASQVVAHPDTNMAGPGYTGKGYEISQHLASPAQEKSNSAPVLIAILAVLISVLLFAIYRLTLKKLHNVQRAASDTAKEALQKTEELKLFNYAVSHDLLQPLENAANFIRLSLNPLDTGYKEGSEIYLQHALACLEDSQRMIGGLRQYAETDQMELLKQTVQTNEVAKSIQKQLLEQHPDRVIHFENGHLPELYGDPLMLRQVLSNLLSNAVKFSSEQAETVIKLWGLETDDHDFIYLEDNGAGIPADGARHVFSLFKTAHSRRRFSGSGIGMAICKRVIERHGGRIELDWTAENAGTRFKLCLPKMT